jgi:cytochrome P450
MTVLDSIINEGLRLVPPVAGVFRETIEETTFDGYAIPKGWAVTLTPAGTHMDATVFHEPECFDPTRYERGEHKQQPFSHIPFGGGPRLCLGQNFAMVEMRIILATALRDYDWSLLPDQDLTLKVLPLPLPKSGAVVHFGVRDI